MRLDRQGYMQFPIKIFLTSMIILFSIARCSKYGLFTYIWVVLGVNIGKNPIHWVSGNSIPAVYIQNFRGWPADDELDWIFVCRGWCAKKNVKQRKFPRTFIVGLSHSQPLVRGAKAMVKWFVFPSKGAWSCTLPGWLMAVVLQVRL